MSINLIVIITIIITLLLNKLYNVIINYINHLMIKDNRKIYLIDIDGTICEDIKNEDSHLYFKAKPIKGAKETINKWYFDGNIITFFTAREEKDKLVTELWLRKHGFKFDSLLMNKPRTDDKHTYHWIDNRPVKATKFNNKWGNLITKNKKVEIFE